MNAGFAAAGAVDTALASPAPDLAGRRIVVYGMNYAPELAGVGRYTGEIGEYLASVGGDVTVVTAAPHYPGWRVQDGYRNAYNATMQDGARVIRTPLLLPKKTMGGIWRLIAPLSFAASSAPVVFWQILRQRPEVVFCVEPTLFAAPVAQLAAKLVGARTVLHVQDLEVDAAFAVGHLGNASWLKRLGFGFEKFSLNRFDRVITISNRMMERLAGKGVAQRQLCILRNWVDVDHIRPLDGSSPYRTELGYQPDDFIVLYSGNVGAKQGLNVLLDAAEQLTDLPRIKFIVAGEGPAKEALQKRYGHLASLRFLPFQPYARFNEFLNLADLHALPQEKDAADLVLPSKLGGMLASGKPIVVTAEPGTELADFLGSGGVITPPGDATALAAEIRRVSAGGFSGDPSLRAALARTLSNQDALKELVRLLGM
ncbi:WcaI family glycosyltransferase [Ancylobacter sp. 6x-1]|uniref:WcaI family glycosyltransferase n=1 Tax=Ancylobacter crimeensis TaxID=2579147 RepID=A0ABT0D6N4_9HYPH|nr:WcaI family glycosyltransferase [Ancylobacter crimeensis]MCK0195599.1 WcaI family glycosyltransferase [Ancylobacter crimeensis]